MNIAIIGSGYVGLVTAACFAKLGHTVTALDTDAEKIRLLKAGKAPFHEPGLAALLRTQIKAGRITFTTSYKEAIPGRQAVFLAVGTPSGENGSADLTYVFAAAKSAAKHLSSGAVIVDKSTVPVGTARKVAAIVRRATTKRFAVASCPEFLREGSAIGDFFKPDRVVIGADDVRSQNILLAIYKGVKAPKLVTTVESAELIKYASNAFLATKISFINEIANVCEHVGADVQTVAQGMGLDSRIGPRFLYAGMGYGGSCFPKDVRALRQIAGGNGYTFQLLKAVIEVNAKQRQVVFRKLEQQLGSLANKRIAVLGLAFKKNTDDIRESAAIDLIRMVLKRGGIVQAFDPIVTESMLAKTIRHKQFSVASTAAAALRNADAVVIATEWDQFRAINWRSAKQSMKRAIVIDGRNLLDPAKMGKLGFRYEAVGRGKA